MIKSILVVEDETIICELLSNILRDEQYEVMTAEHGQQGLERLAEKIPDLVISDMMMPILDGLGLCRAMKADPTYQAIPLVFVSAVDHLISKQDCNCAAIIPKPFDIDRLVATIAHVIEKRL